MRNLTPVTFFACLAVSSLVSAGARAGVIGPGETRSGFEFELGAVPSGTVVSSSTFPFSFLDRDPSDPDPGAERFARGSLTSRVVREDGAAGLTFVYQLEQSAINGIVDLDTLWLRGFGGFATDVLTNQNGTRFSRSGDGDEIRLEFDSSEDVEGIFVVRTDAAGSRAAENLEVEIAFQPSGDPLRQTFSAFEPAAAGPTPVPLPPAAWPALGMMATIAAAGAVRHRRRG
jgi:hypothetical protein